MISELPAYPAYIPSGVPWLGDVPEHWEVPRLKSHILRNDFEGQVRRFPHSYGKVTFLRSSTEQTIKVGDMANPLVIPTEF